MGNFSLVFIWVNLLLDQDDVDVLSAVWKSQEANCRQRSPHCCISGQLLCANQCLADCTRANGWRGWGKSIPQHGPNPNTGILIFIFVLYCLSPRWKWWRWGWGWGWAEWYSWICAYPWNCEANAKYANCQILQHQCSRNKQVPSGCQGTYPKQHEHDPNCTPWQYPNHVQHQTTGTVRQQGSEQSHTQICCANKQRSPDYPGIWPSRWRCPRYLGWDRYLERRKCQEEFLPSRQASLFFCFFFHCVCFPRVGQICVLVKYWLGSQLCVL